MVSHRPPFSLLGKLVWNNRLKLVSGIAIGGYGEVYRALDLETFSNQPMYFAVKSIPIPTMLSTHHKLLWQECHNHRLVSPYSKILTLHDVCEDEDEGFVYLILEFVDGPDLHSAIFRERMFFGDDYLTKTTFLQILNAVQYCHNRNIFHRDLKPENILLQSRGREVEVRLADFGMSSSWTHSTDFRYGTSAYMSPECYAYSEREYACCSNDVWSLGMIFWNMIGSQHPWETPAMYHGLYHAFIHDPWSKEVRIPGVTNEAWNVIVRALDPDPNRRSTIAEMREAILALPAIYTGESHRKKRTMGAGGPEYRPQLYTPPKLFERNARRMAERVDRRKEERSPSARQRLERREQRNRSRNNGVTGVLDVQRKRRSETASFRDKACLACGSVQQQSPDLLALRRERRLVVNGQRKLGARPAWRY